jgi:uridine phosphorylase
MTGSALVNEDLILLPGCNEILLDELTKQLDAEEINTSRFSPLFSIHDGQIQVSLYYPGVGAISIPIALKTMAGLGAKYFFSVGTAGSLSKDLDVGDIVIPYGAIRSETISRHYAPIEYPAIASFPIAKALVNAAERLHTHHYIGITWTVDLPIQERLGIETWKEMGVACVEMEAATLFITANSMKVHSGSVLLISDRAYEGSTSPKMLDTSVIEGYKKAVKIVLEAIKILHDGGT